jgi:hypothetical protein
MSDGSPSGLTDQELRGRRLYSSESAHVKPEVIAMFKWIRSRRPSRNGELTPESAEDKRDSGEDEYDSHEEDDREVAPDGQTRLKTDNI